jgi:CRISPR-associated protein Cas6
LYAHFVAAGDGDELAFLDAVAAELSALGVACRSICGRRQVVEGGALQGYSLMLDGLNAAGALRVLEAGIGRHRRWGCGIFVPHKSAVAVGT